MSLPIETENLGKNYGDVSAVEHLSLRVRRGRDLRFPGPERRRENHHHPHAAGDDQAHRRDRQGAGNPGAPGQPRTLGCGGLPGRGPARLPRADRAARTWKSPAACTPAPRRRRSDQIIERLGLAAYADRRAGTLSQGNAQRLGLAKALLHNPRLLILDEPANGLDPAGIVEIRELLLELTREQGVTVFMSSHILAEVSRLAERIGIIHHGRLLQELDVGELERNRTRRLLVRAREIELPHSARPARRRAAC